MKRVRKFIDKIKINGSIEKHFFERTKEIIIWLSYKQSNSELKYQQFLEKKKHEIIPEKINPTIYKLSVFKKVISN